jgi:hypothetical protein
MKRCSTTSKKKFADELAAAAALGRIRSKAVLMLDPDRKIPVRYYRCDFCGYFHLTSQEKREE